MTIVSVNTAQSYQVIIGNKLLSELGNLIAGIHSGCTAAIISDSNVWPLYGRAVTQSLSDAGFHAINYVFPAGEASKNFNTYLDILNFLSTNHVTRTDLIIALGGGVVGDIAGFAAASYLRGIAYIQLPTTLLAMVDSSVGGKTAIDLPVGKNLVGAFKQPSLVVCDIDALDTLPKKQFLDGCAEVIKYGMLYDSDLIRYLSDAGPEFQREFVIGKCVGYKRDVVQNDEFDKGERQKLNFGHTIGHAIEAMSHYQITHGQAVAAGMAIITKSSASRNLCSAQLYDTLIRLLNKFCLSTNTNFTADELYSIAISDKKRLGDTVNLIIPRDFGNCEIYPFAVSELKSFIKAGL